MRALILLHRWLGVAFCLLFAMWFATGIVMHFVPFPALTEADRFAGLTPLDLTAVERGPADAIAVSGIKDAARVRLLQRSDGPVYVVSGRSGIVALHAADLSSAAVRSPTLALAIATDYARHRDFAAAHAEIAALAPYDQWTLTSDFDPYRPLYRVVLRDGAGSDLYVSAQTGEIVLGTTRRERVWNYVGSIAHWIYPPALRSHPAAWSFLVWVLSFLALIGASLGAAVGTLRIGAEGSRFVSPYRGLQAWHHWLGLFCMIFVLTWIFSGWLSMDDGLFFSTGKPTAAEITSMAGLPEPDALRSDEIKRISVPVKEVEWFAFGGKIYRREREEADQQRLFLADAQNLAPKSVRAYLQASEIDAAPRSLARNCDPAAVVGPGDKYPIAPITPNSPVYRVTCGEVWFHVEAASGVLLEKLDSSRRAYRWLYRALHTLDFPALTARPALRTALIIILCGFGLAFSLTGVVIAWRRLRLSLRLSR